ncbi:MAG: B12-binding domain-containing radical SAM protein [Peptococcaceae bacterium]|nr:B12-binding domain-containing radical SAM protein [Peptococcaceae bacterium]
MSGKDLLLVYPSWIDSNSISGYFSRKAAIFPPLGLCSLAAILEKEGYSVNIIDAQARKMSFDDLIAAILNDHPDILGITASSPYFENAVKIASEIKKKNPGIVVMVGGIHMSIQKEEAMRDCIDFGFVGESETSLLQFMEWYQTQNSEPSMIKGLLYRWNSDIRFTGSSAPIEDLDSLPFPAFHLLDMNDYMIGTSGGRVRVGAIMTTRGCPFQCIFCAPVAGYYIRRHSPQYVLDLIKMMIHKFEIKHFFFFDDTLTLDRKHIEKICDLIISENLDITFEGSTRANLIDEPLVELMYRAGLRRMSFGLESANENVRLLMKKNVPLYSYIEANQITNKFGIETLNSCMIGLPGETIDSIRETLAFLRFFSKDIQQANLSIATPYPGTELAKMAMEGNNGLLLLTNDLNKLKRYGVAVMQVGDLKSDQLVQMQNDAIVSIHMAPSRWPIVVRKFGWWGLFLTFYRFLKALPRIIVNENRFFFFRKSDFLSWRKWKTQMKNVIE